MGFTFAFYTKVEVMHRFYFCRLITIYITTTQGMDDDYGVRMEENGTLSIKVIYDPKFLTFKTLFLGGHLIQSKEKLFEFDIPPAAVQPPGSKHQPRIMFESVHFSGASLDVSYIGFSRSPSGTRKSFLFLLHL